MNKKEMLSKAMLLLAEAELHIDEWNFPITLGQRIKELCDQYYGEARPSFDGEETGCDKWKNETL